MTEVQPLVAPSSSCLELSGHRLTGNVAESIARERLRRGRAREAGQTDTA